MQQGAKVIPSASSKYACMQSCVDFAHRPRQGQAAIPERPCRWANFHQLVALHTIYARHCAKKGSYYHVNTKCAPFKMCGLGSPLRVGTRMACSSQHEHLFGNRQDLNMNTFSGTDIRTHTTHMSISRCARSRSFTS